MPGVFIPSRGAQVQPTGGSEGPPPSWSQSIGSTFRLGRDDQPGHLDEEQASAYGPLASALAEVTGKSVSAYLPMSRNTYFVNKDQFFKDLQAARLKNPNLLQGVPDSADAFDKQWQAKNSARIASDESISARSDWVPWLIGSFGAGLTDPTSFIPFGGASSSLARGALRQAVGGAAVEAGMQPLIAQERAKTGRELTLEEAALNVATAGALGGVLDVSVRGGKIGFDKHIAPVLTKAVDAMTPLEKRLAKALEAENITVGTAVDDAIFGKVVNRLDDEGLADLAEVMIGLDSLTPDERGHIASIRREAQIDGMNPYIPDGAGIAAHRDGLAAAMQRIIDNAPPSAPKARAAPVVPSSGPLPRLRGGTAISSGTVAGDAFAVVKSRIGVVESGGNNRAKNPNSTATGTYQFVSGTWLKLYKSRFGSQGLSDSQIVAKRADGRLQEILMNDLMNANSKALRDGGHAVDAGNLYLAHFAGSGGANKLLRADPNASARSVLGDAVIKANPFLAKMNAADVINWAHRKMTGKGAAVQSGGAGVARDIDVDPEADTRSWIERELAATDAERARLDSEDAIGPSTGAIVDDALTAQPEPFDVSSVDAIEPLRPREPAARLPDAAPVEVLAVLPELRKVVQSRSIRLDRQKEIAEALGTDIETVRAGLGELAKLREIRVKAGKDGTDRFTQIPRDNRPDDLLRFIARRGGLSETGIDPRFADVEGMSRGHALGKGGRDWDKHYVHGVGKLVRKNGRGLDEIGEDLWDAGYFGETRPTESELIDAIEEAVQGRGTRYIPGEAPEERSIKARAPWLDETDMVDMRRDFDGAAEERGISLDDEAFEAVARMYADGDYENVGEAIVDMINREIEADIAAKYYELGDEFDEARTEQALASAREAGFDVDGGFDRPEVDAGNAGAVSASGRNAFGQSANQGPIELAPDAYKPFDDPGEGAGVTSQIDSMEHDLRASVAREEDMFGGATDVEKRQALERRGEGGLSTDAAQKPVGSDGGLFDPDSWAQAGFRLNEEGDVVNPADLLAEFDAEAAILKTIKDCL